MQTDTQFQEKTPILSVLALLNVTSGQKLRVWRKAKGLTQEELAAAVGVNVSYISNLERDFSANTKSGKPRAGEDLCAKLSKVLGVDEDIIRVEYDWAPKHSPIPPELASIGFDDLDKDDLREIADFIRFRKSQKEKEK